MVIVQEPHAVLPLAALEDVAIRAGVADGIVTLSGEVPEAALEERAIEIAAKTPGVVRVESRIEVDLPPVAAPPAQPPGD